VPFGLSRVFSLWLFGFERQREAAWISAISLGVGVIFSFLLVYPLGAVGLALANSIGGLFLLILTIRAFGVKIFLNILYSKKSLILIAVLTCEFFALLALRQILQMFF
jgi:putative peptidoglycan lipid II flippase